MNRDRNLWKAVLALVGLAVASAGGCGRPELETAYGQRSGPRASTSVNGTAVLADMFEQAGHRVTSWYALSPRLYRADCIVWFPDDFHPPSPAVRRWLDEWLGTSKGRTLIYVGRDFDAAPWYWKKVESEAPPEQQPLVRAERLDREQWFRVARSAAPHREDAQWFILEGTARPRSVRQLSGDKDWCAGIDPAGLDIELTGRMAASRDTNVILASRGDLLVGREQVDNSQRLVVANGSFLVNAALVNHEHRKLAGKLIEAIGRQGQHVVFLESSHGGPPIRDGDPVSTAPTGLEIFHLWPTNWILLQLAAMGIIFCFSRIPIFGRPRPPEPPGTSDFGKHVDAVAALLRRSRDRAYAMARVAHYRQIAKKTD